MGYHQFKLIFTAVCEHIWELFLFHANLSFDIHEEKFDVLGTNSSIFIGVSTKVTKSFVDFLETVPGNFSCMISVPHSTLGGKNCIAGPHF